MNQSSFQVTSASGETPRAIAIPSTPPLGLHVTPQRIGERLRTARIAAHKTQQDLQGDTYSRSYISAIERGTMTPSFQALVFLAERLGVSVAYFLGEQVVDSSPLAEASDVAHATPEREAQTGAERLARLSREADALIQHGQYEQAAGYLQQHLEAAQQRGDARTRGVALGAFVALHTARGEYTHAIAVAREALEVLQAQQDHPTVAQVYLSLVTASVATHDEGAAEQAFQAAITAFEQAGDGERLSQTHEQYGQFLAARKRYQDAYEQLQLALTQDADR